MWARTCASRYSLIKIQTQKQQPTLLLLDHTSSPPILVRNALQYHTDQESDRCGYVRAGERERETNKQRKTRGSVRH